MKIFKIAAALLTLTVIALAVSGVLSADGATTATSAEVAACPCKWDGPEYCPDVVCLNDSVCDACPCKWDGPEYCPDVVCVCER